ncbi:MAG TPA: PAS domain S-box protein, partial [Flavitalea sp.]|nr:PAS domain S-box protein [Flavitalea sp.]
MKTMDALNILLLEDSPEDAEIVERLLRKTIPGNKFGLVMNKDAYVKALDEFQPDIILSDNNLPMFSAQEALTIIQERSLFVPFILVTGTVSEEFAANIIKAGADDYILKDRLTRLPVAIEGALRRQQLKKERTEAIEQLRSSEEKYRTLFLRSPVPKWIYDFETLHFLEVNEAAVAHYGYSAEEFQKMTLRDIRPPEELHALEDDLERIPTEHEARIGNWIHVKKNGERIIVETTAQFIEYQDRKARIVVINDITERVRAEE